MTENSEFVEVKGTGKISVSDQTNSLQYTNMKSDSFTVDMERFTHITNKDISLDSRINRSHSRKGSQRWGEKKVNLPSTDSDRDRDSNHTPSPRAAALVGVTTPEKPMVVTVGTRDQAMNPQVHHQITITTGHIATTTSSAATISAAESRLGGKRFSFRHSSSSSSSWTIDPRRILFFFATLSSMGTILLIYFTLSMSKLSADDSLLN